jgi:two-component system sensor histidine kinase PhoQ
MHSLSARLLLSLSLLLLVFFGVTVAALTFVFSDLSQRSLRDLLDVQVLALISASDVDATGRITAPADLLDTRYATPGSGLYAEIRDSHANVRWRSPSALGTGLNFGAPVGQGERRYRVLRLATGGEVVALSAGYRWEIAPHVAENFEFSVATSLEPSRAQLARFRGQLLAWFGALATLLVISLALLLRRVLEPLRRVAEEIRAVDAGERSELSADYPSELSGVTQGLNALLRSERLRVERYRNTLGNLAHSLKTPLAVMRSVLGEGPPAAGISRTLDEQIERIDSIVQYQLKRSASFGSATLGQAGVTVLPVLSDLRTSLLRVYREKDLVIRIECAPAVEFIGDRGDLLELLGNLLDNACKYCRGIVQVKAGMTDVAASRITLLVEDDGKGVPAEARERILVRGVRVDESASGQGLGLSIARDIVAQYGGELRVAESALGGARFELTLPGRATR